MSTIFSTDTLEQKDRFNYWNDVVTKHYAPCLGVASDTTQFKATTTVQHVGSTELSHVASESIRYDRRVADLRSVPREDIFLSVMLEGEGYFEQNERQVSHQVGDILIYDSGKPYSFNYTSAYKAMLLRIPRPLIQAKVTRLDNLGGTVLNDQSSFGRLIKSLMNETSIIASSPDLINEDEFIVPTLDMLTTAISRATSTDTPIASHNKLLNEIKTYIRNHITDEELSLESVASEKGISLRTLSRLFAEAGETPRNWLQSQRLSCAYDALANKRVTNITEAALTFGYKDLSHFSRTFKKQFGYSPRELTR
ncbi:helix-turn-helix domain-containing protein [Vibrio sp. LQ2]|uniref:helix-turn-helix domain-containing protein n=1 Tax=Vibrio sp. LQ2 TaxID=2883075 RepID=UPI00208FA84C|nr:helix-turn-helix domain-containing protein [Vibrio sp. LQ2]USP04521.1 helix-turn-helix domain-containing protein [Vibrio sp. LQ2]